MISPLVNISLSKCRCETQCSPPKKKKKTNLCFKLKESESLWRDQCSPPKRKQKNLCFKLEESENLWRDQCSIGCLSHPMRIRSRSGFFYFFTKKKRKKDSTATNTCLALIYTFLSLATLKNMITTTSFSSRFPFFPPIILCAWSHFSPRVLH